MAQTTDTRGSYEERIAFWTLILTWPFYLIGALYFVGPLLAVGLTCIISLRWYIAPRLPDTEQAPAIPTGIWVWILGMIAMLIILWVGHMLQHLSVGQAIKSAIGWAKGWLLLALFPLIGACGRIRAERIARANSILGLWTLLVMPIFIMSASLGLPERLYVSPFSAVGGPGPEFFAVDLYTIDPRDHSLRLRFFTPWSPAAGIVSVMMILIALFCEPNRRWQIIGVLAGLAMAYLSKSRMALLAVIIMPCIGLSPYFAKRAWAWFTLGGASMLFGLFGSNLVPFVLQKWAEFKGARADSTRVREALARIAIDRWREEAPIWGHGIVERGPHYVEYMYIGSHNTWMGLLFVKGILGVFALLIPLLWSLFETALLAFHSRIGQAALSFSMLMLFFSFGENLEILAYLIWPGLVLIGIAHREAAILRQNTRRRKQSLPSLYPAIKG